MRIEFNAMFSKSTWLHLRIPFSFFLLPVYLFALGISPNFTKPRLIWTFIIVHFLLYPASNGYNSYFDKDEKSIGGLSNPPPVERGLYVTSLLLDGIALVLGFLKIGLLYAIMLLIYGMVSKAYSHPLVRLKKYPVTGWLTVACFQGFFAFTMCYVGINGFGLENILNERMLLAGTLCTLLLLGSYPMTQIYQHEEDAKHGDTTISMKLGIMGTFYLAMIVFAVTSLAFYYFFHFFYSDKYSYRFLIALTPTITFFLYWLMRARKDESNANHYNLMWLNFLSALCLNIFFSYFFLDSTQVLQAIEAGY